MRPETSASPVASDDVAVDPARDAGVAVDDEDALDRLAALDGDVAVDDDRRVVVIAPVCAAAPGAASEQRQQRRTRRARARRTLGSLA